MNSLAHAQYILKLKIQFFELIQQLFFFVSEDNHYVGMIANTFTSMSTLDGIVGTNVTATLTLSFSHVVTPVPNVIFTPPKNCPTQNVGPHGMNKLVKDILFSQENKFD